MHIVYCSLPRTAVEGDPSNYQQFVTVTGGAAKARTPSCGVHLIDGAPGSLPLLFSYWNTQLRLFSDCEALVVHLALSDPEGLELDAGSVKYTLCPRNFGKCGPEWVPLFSPGGLPADGFEVLVAVSCCMLSRARDDPQEPAGHGGFMKVSHGSQATPSPLTSLRPS